MNEIINNIRNGNSPDFIDACMKFVVSRDVDMENIPHEKCDYGVQGSPVWYEPDEDALFEAQKQSALDTLEAWDIWVLDAFQYHCDLLDGECMEELKQEAIRIIKGF